MQKFYDSNNETIFIQALLYNTYLPLYETVNLGSYIIQGYRYIFETELIECTETGYIAGKTEAFESIITVSKIAKYKVLYTYEFGKHYYKFTDNYISKNSIYDKDTHNRLVEYLRCYRDIKGIDLLPFINLYTDDYLSESKLISSTNSTTKVESLLLKEYVSSGFTQLKIPIRFNTTYTIAVDCNTEVLVAPAFFSHDSRLVIKAPKVENDRDLTNEFNSLTYTVKERVQGVEQEVVKTAFRRYLATDFRNPVTYRVDLDCLTEDQAKEYYKYKDCLYMLIQLPQLNKSSVVVLEGDYTHSKIFYGGKKYEQDGEIKRDTDIMTCTEHIVNLEYDDIHSIMGIHEYHHGELNKICLSSLSLLQFSTTNKYVYSNRLMEYLTKNIIDSEDILDTNIEVIQALMPDLKESDYTAGVWGDVLRYKIYRYSETQKNSTMLDLNGFVDKDTEYALVKRISTIF